MTFIVTFFVKYMKKKEDILKTIEQLKAISQFISTARTNLSTPYHLTPTQTLILLDVAHHPTHTKITDICKRLNKTTHNISPLVNRLIKKGYMLKQQNQMDNRIYEVFLSDYGKEILSQIDKNVLDIATPIFESLSEEEFAELSVSLQKLSKVCGL